MNRVSSAFRGYALGMLIGMLLCTGCAQRKIFYFAAPSAKMPKMEAKPLEDSGQSDRQIFPVMAEVSQDAYVLEASVAKPISSKSCASVWLPAVASAQRQMYAPKTKELEEQLLKWHKQGAEVTARQLGSAVANNKEMLQHGNSDKEEKTPESKSIRMLISLGLASSAVALIVGLTGVASLYGGGFILLGSYLALLLLGGLFYGLALSKIANSPDPEAYAKDKRVVMIGLLVITIPAIALALLFGVVLG